MPNSIENDCKKPITNKQHIEWINTVRVFTLLLVVLGHCDYYNISTPHGGINFMPEDSQYCFLYYVIRNITLFIYTFHMQLFMALSGMCFSFSKLRYATLSTLTINKFKRLLIPFFAVTTFLSVPLKYLSGYWDHTSSPIYDIIIGQYLLIHGNSHLWFLVTLFIVFLLFYLMNKHIKVFNLLFWGILVFFSIFIHPLISAQIGSGLGLANASKYLLFFSIGFITFNWFHKKTISVFIILLSWIGMLLSFYIFLNNKSRLDYPIFLYIKQIINILFALWGSFNMIITCKIVSKSRLIHTNIYHIFSKYNYKLYLYSDPFNYIIILALIKFLDKNLFVSDTLYCISYVIRFVGTITLPLLIIYTENKIHICISKRITTKRKRIAIQ